jgi:hypothetical protein
MRDGRGGLEEFESLGKAMAIADFVAMSEMDGVDRSEELAGRESKQASKAKQIDLEAKLGEMRCNEALTYLIITSGRSGG